MGMTAMARVAMGGVALLILALTGWAQEEQAVAPVDIANEGQAMEQAAGEVNFEQVFVHAQRILGAAGGTIEGRTPDELWYIGLAHQYLMGQAMDAAVAAGLPGERQQIAISIARRVLRTYEDVRVVSHGERINLSDYLVSGQTVIFDFSSQFCPPCMAIAPHLERLAEGRDDIVLVTVDINRPGVQGIDWSSPVAQQFGLRSIPHFKIYGPDGRLQAEGDQAYSLIMQWLQAQG
ncbi:MAG: TlpA family protein disulfide reductase [Armatimonadota bacterium]